MEQLSRGRRKYLPALFAFLGVLLFVNLFSSTDYLLLSAVVNLQVVLADAPHTRVVLPPVGEIRARTHWFPVQIKAELRSVDLNSLRSTVFSPVLDEEQILHRIQEGFPG